MAIVLIGVIIIVILGVLAATLGVWLVRRARGSLRLDIPARGYRAGDVIEGTVQVESKRELGPGAIVVSLVCIEEWHEWETDSDGDRRREKKTREVYRYDLDLETEVTMGPSQQRSIPFYLPTPSPRGAGEPEPTSTFARLAATLGEAMRADRDYVWRVKGRYDIPGLDLVADHQLQLDYRP